MVTHRAGVAGLRASGALGAELGLRRGGRQGEAVRGQRGEHQPRPGPAIERRRLPALEQGHDLVDVVDFEVAAHVGPADPELPGRAQGLGHGAR